MHGHVDEAFEPVRDVFAGLVASGVERGASLAVLHRGRLVVDLAGSWRDAARRYEWAAGTVSPSTRLASRSRPRA